MTKAVVGDRGSKEVAAGNPDLARLVRDHGPLVYRIAVAIVHDHSLAEDIVQDVMLKAWTSLPIDSRDHPGPWLRVVTRNASIDMLRRRRFDDITEHPPEPPASATIDQTVEARQRLAEVWTALATLDEASRTMLILRETEDMSYSDIGEMLGISSSAVRTKLYRARHALRAKTGNWEA